MSSHSLYDELTRTPEAADGVRAAPATHARSDMTSARGHVVHALPAVMHADQFHMLMSNSLTASKRRVYLVLLRAIEVQPTLVSCTHAYVPYLLWYRSLPGLVIFLSSLFSCLQIMTTTTTATTLITYNTKAAKKNEEQHSTTLRTKNTT